MKCSNTTLIVPFFFILFATRSFEVRKNLGGNYISNNHFKGPACHSMQHALAPSLAQQFLN